MPTTRELLTFNGVEYTVDQLDQAFDKVKSWTHWKDPIHKGIDEADKAIIEAAIIFYTATVPEFYYDGDQCYVVANGYRAGPAGDH